MPKVESSINGLKSDTLYQEWFNSERISKSTMSSYSYALQKYCEFTKLTPENLIKEAREDSKKNLGAWEIRAIEHYEGFVTYLKKQNGDMSDSYKHLLLMGVKAFYKFYKVPLVTDVSISSRISDKYRDIKPLKMDDIQKAIRMAGHNKMIKAMILCLLASGQGQCELRSLKGYHLKNVVNGVVVVRMARHRSKKEYFFFLNQEAVDSINEYKPNLQDDGFVFTQMYKSNELTGQEWAGFMARHAEKCGFDREYFQAHRFRHRFKSALEGHMTPAFIEFLMGHRLAGSQDYYLDADESLNKMIAEYAKNQPLLTAYTNHEKLEQDYEKLKERCQATKIENIEKLQSDYDELKQKMDYLMDLTKSDKNK